MATAPKKQELPAIREQRSLLRGINLRTNANAISPTAFNARRDFLVTAYESGLFLKEPDKKGQAAPNPMTDPAAMDGMMGMMKGNMMMMVPQTLIMGWINAFFSGFVVSKCLPSSTYKRRNANTSSTTSISPDYKVQEHATSWRSYERYGSSMDVLNLVVCIVYLRPSISLQLSTWK